MDWLDLTLPTPAANLAADEALLERAEAGEGGEVLRFWESGVWFVVVGHGNRVADEVNAAECAVAGVPILRRCSGGGTVLQGPGCLNYGLILEMARRPELATVTGANRFIMNRHAEALSDVLSQPVAVAGVTDLVLGDRKFSGNAQRRTRRFLLFHGTFLLGLDADAVERFLGTPSRQPAYRARRGHRAFLTCLSAPPGQVKAALRRAWAASAALDAVPWDRVDRLVATRYGRPEWNMKF
jgi:lipoate-protein ligase A